jgi:hypothetical protein
MRAALRVVALAFVFLTVLEATARTEDWVRYRTPFLSRMTESGQLMIRDVDGAHGRPGGRYQKWVMDSLGLRGPEVARAPRPGVVRVVTVGASETFGLFESPQREYPRQLQDSLNSVRCRGGRTYEVLNAALPGMVLPTITRDVETRLRRLRPEVIVIYPSPLFYLDEVQPFATPPDSTGRDQLPAWRALVPRTYDRLREQLKLLLPKWLQIRMRRQVIANELHRHPPGWRFTTVPADRMAAYDSDLRRLIGAIRASGATPVLMTHANYAMQPGDHDPNVLNAWAKILPRATEGVIVSFDSAARFVTLRVATDSAVIHADVAAELSKHFEKPVYADFAHFTDFGSARVAAIAAAAVRRALPDCSDRMTHDQPSFLSTSGLSFRSDGYLD